MKKMLFFASLLCLISASSNAESKGVFYGPPEAYREYLSVKPSPVEEKKITTVDELDLSLLSASKLQNGVRFVGRRYGSQTTETLMGTDEGKKLSDSFQAAQSCHWPAKAEFTGTISVNSGMLIDHKTVSGPGNPYWGERHVSITLTTATDKDNSATLWKLASLETWEGTVSHPVVRREKMFIRKEGKVIFYREITSVK